MSHVFLSYRRDDSAGFAGRLADALEAEFGVGSVFRDVDDIRPGEDFVQSIETQLEQVGAVLVMIGPRWLNAGKSAGMGGEAGEQRRLDDPSDFVRREIQAALASGKPLIPLLVGGAAMPDEAALPPALAGLARRQAVVLSDNDWRADVARLAEALRPFMADRIPAKALSRRRLFGLMGGVLGLILLAWAIQAWWPSDTSSAKRKIEPADLAGRWTARVKYDWGDSHDEVFEFKYLGGKLHGTASFLTGRLTIEQAVLEDGWLRFVTRSQEMLNDSPPKEVTHRYTGQVAPMDIHFTLESSGGYSVHPPIEFTAHKAAGVAGGR